MPDARRINRPRPPLRLVDERDFKFIATAIVREIPDATVVVFGRYARGDATPDEDLDLLVCVPEGVAAGEAAVRLRECLPVDVEFVSLVVIDDATDSHALRTASAEGREIDPIEDAL